MRSAHECILEAERLERWARATDDAANRRMLLDTARIWRGLADGTPNGPSRARTGSDGDRRSTKPSHVMAIAATPAQNH